MKLRFNNLVSFSRAVAAIAAFTVFPSAASAVILLDETGYYESGGYTPSHTWTLLNSPLYPITNHEESVFQYPGTFWGPYSSATAAAGWARTPVTQSSTTNPIIQASYATTHNTTGNTRWVGLLALTSGTTNTGLAILLSHDKGAGTNSMQFLWQDSETSWVSLYDGDGNGLAFSTASPSDVPGRGGMLWDQSTGNVSLYLGAGATPGNVQGGVNVANYNLSEIFLDAEGNTPVSSVITQSNLDFSYATIGYFILGDRDVGGRRGFDYYVSAVPEPGTVALLGAGGLMLLLSRIRRRAS